MRRAILAAGIAPVTTPLILLAVAIIAPLQGDAEERWRMGVAAGKVATPVAYAATVLVLLPLSRTLPALEKFRVSTYAVLGALLGASGTLLYVAYVLVVQFSMKDMGLPLVGLFSGLSMLCGTGTATVFALLARPSPR